MRYPDPTTTSAALVALLASATPAYAYLDPGTGSMLLQLLVGGVGGALVVGKLYWARLKAMIMRRKPGEQESTDQQTPDGDR